MIKFIEENAAEGKILTFGDVKEDQFFANSDGWLCHKAAADKYFVIAKIDGTPYSNDRHGVDEDTPIQRILPTIKKIEF